MVSRFGFINVHLKPSSIVALETKRGGINQIWVTRVRETHTNSATDLLNIWTSIYSTGRDWGKTGNRA